MFLLPCIIIIIILFIKLKCLRHIVKIVDNNALFLDVLIIICMVKNILYFMNK